MESTKKLFLPNAARSSKNNCRCDHNQCEQIWDLLVSTNVIAIEARSYWLNRSSFSRNENEEELHWNAEVHSPVICRWLFANGFKISPRRNIKKITSIRFLIPISIDCMETRKVVLTIIPIKGQWKAEKIQYRPYFVSEVRWPINSTDYNSVFSRNSQSPDTFFRRNCGRPYTYAYYT